MKRVIPLTCGTACQFIGSSSSCEKEDDGFKVSQRLRSALLNPSILRERFKAKLAGEKISSTIGDLKVYTLFNKEGKYQFEGEGALPIARMATIEVTAEPALVADLLEDISTRKEWDDTCVDSQKTITKDGTTILSYFRGKPGYVVPAREFVFTQSRLNGAVVGKDYSAIVIFCKDASDKLPNLSLNRVRGRINSLLILEPLGLTKTRVTYLVEMDAGGIIAKWLMGNGFSNFVAGDSPVSFLSSLKKAAEAHILDESLGVEEAARITFQKSLKKRDSFGSSIVDDVGLASATSKEDLLATVKVLEARLADIRRSERADKLNLSELRARVSNDLEKAKQQLRTAR